MMNYDIVMIGHICRDVISDPSGKRFAPGGAVFYSSIAASRSGAKVFVLSKGSLDAEKLYSPMTDCGVTVENLASKDTTSMECIYQSDNKEKRDIVHVSSADNYKVADLSALPEGRVYHVAGLIAGEFSEELIPVLHERNGIIAMDVQTMVRFSNSGSLEFHDWKNKKKYLPMIGYLKTDAAEAEVITGLTDREAAARRLAEWGCAEIMITHNSEVLIYESGQFHRAPFSAKNLSGRSGRGDTTFAAYISERLSGKSPEDSIRYAAALCSIKMETEGPFSGNREDVYKRLDSMDTSSDSES